MVQSELYRRGLEQLRAGHYDEAKRLFHEHEQQAGTASETQSMLRQAEGFMASGDAASAASLYEKLLERNPSLPEVYFGLIRLSLFAGDLDAARTHAKAAVKLAPALGMTWALQGLVHEAEGDLQGALSHLTKAVELAPSAFLCQFNLGRVYASLGRPAEGLAPLMQATRLEPRNPAAYYTLGLAYKQAHQDTSALRAFEQARDLAPKNVDYWATLGDALFSMKKYQAARDTLDQGLARCGDHPALLEKALAATMMLSDTPGAIAYIERELKVVPNHEQGWINLANLLLLQGDFDKSEQAARELLKRNPNNWEAWYHLGNLYEAVPVEKEAEEAYRKAVALAPGNWKPLTNLAGLLIQMKSKDKNAEAVPLLEKALALVPQGEWRVHYNLALAYTRLGQRERALELARRIQREAPPTDAMVQEAKKLESNLLEAAARN